MNVTFNGVVYQVWSELDINKLVFDLKSLQGLTLQARKVS